MVPVFYAIGNTRFPVIASFLGVAANVLTITLVIDVLQHRGIALSTSCAMILNFLFLGVVLCRKLDGLPLGYLATGLGRILLAAGLMSAAIWGGQHLLGGWLAGPLWMQIAAMALLIGVAVGIYGAGLQLLRLPEFTLLTGKLAQRLRRS